jgi:pilus assembly protein CpaC
MIRRPASGAPRQNSPLRAVALFVAMSVAAPHAQMLQGTMARASEPAEPAAASTEATEVQLLVGRSTVISVGQPIARVSLTTPNVADAMVTSPQQLLLHGKTPGTISLFVWDRAGGITRYQVNVQRDLSELSARLAQLFPGERILVSSNGKDVVLSGEVSGKYVIEKAADVAAGYVEKKEDVVNLLKQEGGPSSRQVLLRVRFAEVSRSALTELGVGLFTSPLGVNNTLGRTTTQQFSAPTWTDQEWTKEGLGFGDKVASAKGKFAISDFLNLFFFSQRYDLGAAIRALQEKGLFQSLAEPNLIAEDGKEASFLAGGEYPYPVVQGQSGGTSVTIQFKEFGIRLNFIPNIVGDDLVKLKVRPEVSSLDFANAVTLQGFRVPAITTRRTETEVELQDGQTFAVAGLMNNTVTSQMSKIPGIGDIPILGLLFRSKAARKDNTELVVMITPTILRRNSTGVSSTIPDMIEPFMPPPHKTMPPPAPWNRDGSRPQSSNDTAPVPPPMMPAPAPRPATADAAAVAIAPSQPIAEPVTPLAELPGVAQAAPADGAEPPTGTAALSGRADRQADRERADLKRQARDADGRVQKQTREEQKRAEKQARAAAEKAERDRKAQARLDAKKAAEDKKQAEKAAKEQARLEAELGKQQAEAARRQAEIDKQRGEEIARAEQKLKAAQKDYDAALGQKPPK